MPGYETYLFWLEIVLAIILPLCLLVQKKVRNSATGLYLSAVLVVLGIHHQPDERQHHGDGGIDGRAVLPQVERTGGNRNDHRGSDSPLFGLAVKYLPIFPKEEFAVEKSPEPKAVAGGRGDGACRRLKQSGAGWFRLTHSLSAKLNLLLLGAMLVIFALLGYLNVRLHRQHLEQNTLQAAERISDVIKQGTTDYMLRNDREGLYQSIQTMAAEPGIDKIRIFDQEGQDHLHHRRRRSRTMSSIRRREACYGMPRAIAAAGPAESSRSLSDLPQRWRKPRAGDYHSDRESAIVLQRCLPRASGDPADSGRARHQPVAGQGRRSTGAKAAGCMIAYTAVRSGADRRSELVFCLEVVGRPVQGAGTRHRASDSQGDLGYQIEFESEDEIGELARSFNDMSASSKPSTQKTLPGLIRSNSGSSRRPAN